MRDPGTDKVNYAKRIAYVIDPDGVIRKSYQVADVNTFTATVLDDLRALESE